MTVKPLSAKSIVLTLVFAACTGAFAQNRGQSVSLYPAQPTHYLYMPTGQVNNAGDLVIGLHELSYAMPGHLQVQASIMDNIGRTDLALKYGFASNMSIGGGLAHTLVNMGYHGIHSGNARVGLFFVHDLLQRRDMAMSYVVHSQIGDHFSIGADFGMRITPVNFWSFIWEAGLSVDATDSHLYAYGIGGLRIHPPSVPFLFVTVGVSTQEFPLTVEHPSTRARAYIDVMIAFKT